MGVGRFLQAPRHLALMAIVAMMTPQDTTSITDTVIDIIKVLLGLIDTPSSSSISITKYI